MATARRRGSSWYAEMPAIHPTAFVAPTATVVGDVRLAEESSIWFGAVLRGDIEPVVVGPRSNVQDGCILHTGVGEPAIVGADVTLGHGAIVHGCRIGDNVLVGMRATLLNGAQVGDNCLIGAGALVTQGTIIPPGSLVLGMPAKVIRPLTPEEIESIRISAAHYVEYARRYLAGEF
jgi:carbonic anhydrase/acetyltransferase-like protein (isoleucine patch superfamily)